LPGFDNSQTSFSVLAPAKINLLLHVGERRDDGYHALESLIVFAETGDRLTFYAVRGSLAFAERTLRREANRPTPTIWC
jgi:4-diphosphocytidyl-2C-methyl-D-erythritol kinase